MKIEILLRKLGYTMNDRNKLLKYYSERKEYEETVIKRIEDIFDYLFSFGFKKEEIIKINMSLISLYSHNLNSIKEKLEFFTSLGYNKQETIKIVKTQPSVLTYSVDNMNKKISDLVDLGFSKEDLFKMILELPTLFSMSMDTIKDKIQNIISLGYTKEETFDMVKRFSTIMSYSKDGIKKRIEFLNSVNLREVLIKEPKQIMQSAEIDYARYEYYKEEEGLNITMDNYKLLFIGGKKFKSRSGYTKGELLEKYKMNEKVFNDGKGIL